MMAVNRLPKQTDPNDVVVDRRNEAVTAEEQNDDAS